MRLYSTIQSERATKGQGGNKYITGTFTCDEDEVVKVIIQSYNDDEWSVIIKTPEGEHFQTYPKQKGEKQRICKYCDGLLSENGTMQCYGEHDNYKEAIKGEKQ